MAAYSAQPGREHLPGPPWYPAGVETLPDSQRRDKDGRRCSLRASILPGVRLLPTPAPLAL